MLIVIKQIRSKGEGQQIMYSAMHALLILSTMVTLNSDYVI